MITEKLKELTEISVDLCREGIFSFKIISALTSIKSSKNAAINPPAITIYGLSLIHI